MGVKRDGTGELANLHGMPTTCEEGGRRLIDIITRDVNNYLMISISIKQLQKQTDFNSGRNYSVLYRLQLIIILKDKFITIITKELNRYQYKYQSYTITKTN